MVNSGRCSVPPPNKALLRTAVAALIAGLGALSYPFLLFVYFGRTLSPFHPESPWLWRIAAEHGELEFQHCYHFVVALFSALPLVIASRFSAARYALFL